MGGKKISAWFDKSWFVIFPRHTKGPLVITGHDLNVTVHFYIIADKVHEHDSSREMTVGHKAPYI